MSSSIRRRWSASRRARVRTVQPRRAASRAPAIRIASGRPAHAASTSPTGAGSAAARSSPMIRGQQCSRLVVVEDVQVDQPAAGQVGQAVPGVTITAQDALPGSSGRTWAASLASSSTISTRRSVSRVRYSAARSSSVGRDLVAAPPRDHAAAGPAPRRAWPAARLAPQQADVELAVGEFRRSACAAWMASAVLPRPGVPATTAMFTAAGLSARRPGSACWRSLRRCDPAAR